MKKIVIPMLLGGSLALSAQSKQPNIVLILADDLGFSDLGCFGGEIHTPVLDNLAGEGVRFTQMYNSARSCPSRASLLTGLYPHQVGMGHMEAGNSRKDWPQGYSGFRGDNNVTIAEVLRQNGYYTAMSGKWHLGAQKPTERGFEDFYGLLGGFTSFWDQTKYTRLPDQSTLKVYPEGEFYATDAITEHAVEFAGKAKAQQKPLFLYLAYNAPHFPLHAPKERIDKYMETYLKGWDAIKDERYRRAMQMGLLQGSPEDTPRGVVPGSMFVDTPHDIPAWDSLSPDQQKDLARRMAIYSAMVDIMDENIGQVLAALKQNGQLDNTLIFFMSDNGACAEWHEFGFDHRTGTEYHTFTGNELDQMGQKDTYHHYGTGWANACNAPLTLYKHFAHEGGISTPGILWWGKNVAKKGRIDHQPSHFVDIMATCLDASGSAYPAEFNGRKVLPMEGVSILPMVKNKAIKQQPIFAEHEGNRMARMGDWKLVASQYNGLEWQLYNIKADRTERRNLIAEQPAKAKELKDLYYAWAERCHVESFPQMWNRYMPNGPHLEVYDGINLADPTIVCFDGTYYMYGTERSPQKGFPVLQSKNLRQWEIPSGAKNGHALTMGESVFGTKGFWAPQILRHNGRYYMIYTANENIAIAESASPAGPFVQKEIKPIEEGARQIDPYLFFDDDGKAYLYHVRLFKGNTIWVAEFEDDFSGIRKETLKQCITATEPWEDTKTFRSPQIIEGPTVIKRDGFYYLFYSANDFQSKDYAVGYAVSRSPSGPWEKPEGNPIISRHNISGENGTGHGDLFQDTEGNWKYVFHTHYNDSTVHPRRTFIVDLRFVRGKAGEPETVVADGKSVYEPQFKK